METESIYLKDNDLDEEKINKAGKYLSEGQVVAFPTETVYGLGGDYKNPEAIEKIYKAKGRPSDNPLIVHISKLEDVGFLSSEISQEAKTIMENFWPGPITIILKAREEISKKVTGGLDTVGIRMPDNEIALGIIEASGTLIAAPSANTSGRPSPTKGEHVLEDLGGKIKAIVVGDDSKIGTESTVVDLTCKPALILRPGKITKEEIEKFIPVEYESQTLGKKDLPKAPGMKYKHYAPKGEVFILTGKDQEKKEKILAKVEETPRMGLLISKELIDFFGADRSLIENNKAVNLKVLGTREKLETYLGGLYSSLREFDSEDEEIIFVEDSTEEGLGITYLNRVLKAANKKKI